MVRTTSPTRGADVSYELHTSKLSKRGMGRRVERDGRRAERDGEEGGEEWGGARGGMGRSYNDPSMYITSLVQ